MRKRGSFDKTSNEEEREAHVIVKMGSLDENYELNFTIFGDDATDYNSLLDPALYA